jgi:hypothetical protein
MKLYRPVTNHSPHFKLNVNYEVLETSENGLHYSKEPLKIFVLIGRSIVALLKRTANERKMAVSPYQRKMSLLWYWEK